MSQLQLKGFAKPFFIQYRIEDVDDFATKAEFGASEGSEHSHQRVARVTVRVGDYKTDSSGGRGDGSLELAALDDDPIALRSALWTATDQAYKSALAAYAQKQAELKQVQTPPQADDFSHEKPVISLADPAQLTVDEAAWDGARGAGQRALPHRRGVKANEQQVQYSTAEFHARVTTTWLVTSEGTIVRKSATEYQEAFGAGTQAADGMQLDRSYASTGHFAEAIWMRQRRSTSTRWARLLRSSDLRKAPLVDEEYHGPLLLSADAERGHDAVAAGRRR